MSLLNHFKPCVSFHSHGWIQTRATVRKCPIWVKIGDWSRVILNLTNDLENHWSASSMSLQALCIISQPAVNSNWSYSPEAPKLGQNLFLPLCPWPLSFDLDLMHGHQFVYGNNSWKFNDDTMTGILCIRCHNRTDRRTDRSVLRGAWSQLKI